MMKTPKPHRIHTIVASWSLALLCAAGANAATGRRAIHEFTGGPDGGYPVGEPAKVGKSYYGVTYLGGDASCEDGCGTVYQLSGKELSTLYTFAGGDDGYKPIGPLLFYNQELYGVTAVGGTYDMGTIYKVSLGGVHTVLYSFVGGSEGYYPDGVVVADAEGSIYGKASGGTDDSGLIYKLATNGEFTVLHSFVDHGPNYGLVADSEGNLYGTTTFGGTGSGDQCSPFGCGTVYKITASGEFSFIHNFQGGVNDGSLPYGGLTIDAENNLYGTTYEGGGFEDGTGLGTVYKLTTTGDITILHSFERNGGDGVLPYEGVSLDPVGNLYGVTRYGGANSSGVIYKVAPDGQETILIDNESAPSADFPSRPVPRSRRSLIYTTVVGGANDLGAIYEVKY